MPLIKKVVIPRRLPLFLFMAAAACFTCVFGCLPLLMWEGMGLIRLALISFICFGGAVSFLPVGISPDQNDWKRLALMMGVVCALFAVTGLFLFGYKILHLL